MRIQSSMIGMESARSYKLTKTSTQRFFLKENQADIAKGNDTPLENETMEKESAEETKSSANSMEELQNRMSQIRYRRNIERETPSDTMDTLRQYTAKYLLILLFGSEKVKEWMGPTEGDNLSTGENTLTFTPPTQMLYVKEEGMITESETCNFSTTGCVKTADGRKISFQVDVSMSREFRSYYSKEWTMLKPSTCDPLVINFDGDVAALRDQKFMFDIDANGEKEAVSLLAEGSGYLALDKNEDGIINDGNELFGPQNGDGFADLAQYDSDHNGWIDENDAIWSKLKIWCKMPDGRDELYTLAQKGVGAICLQKTSTEFALKNQQNRADGFIRSTGVFLFENGNAGTIQHLDLVK